MNGAPSAEPTDEPLLPEAISDLDVEMRGRFAWQWQTPEKEWVVLYNGDFQLTIGRRKLSARDSVIWLRAATDPRGRAYTQLTVYLSGDAEVRESGGTTTVDNVLLVSNLRTYGSIEKSQDSHTEESAEKSDLYQRAKLDRAGVEAGLPVGVDFATVRKPGGPAGVAAPSRSVRYNLGNVESATTPDNSTVYVASGGVYFSQGGRGAESEKFVEIRATSAVIFPAEQMTAGLLDGVGRGSKKSQGADETGVAATSRPARGGEMGRAQNTDPGFGFNTEAIRQRIRAVYLEGDVVLSYGSRFVRASRLYYDFELGRAIILDAVLRAEVPARGIPLYVRADEIRQLSETEYQASNAKITSSEFFTPHYHVGVEKLYLRNLSTTAAPQEAPIGVTAISARPRQQLAGEYDLQNATLNIENTPVLSWPRAQGRLDQADTAIRSFSTGYDGDFGYTVRSSWYLFNLLGMQAPPGVDATLRMDYFSDRGPAVGINSDYETADNYGLLRTYYISDRGFDSLLGPIRRSAWEPESDNRGRALWRHREFLPEDWQLTLEASYVSDPNFLEMYERSEWFEGKDQETLVHLKRARDVEAIVFWANWRTLDFVTQTEHLPELEYRRIGDILPGTPLTLYHESRLGAVRYRPDDRRYFDDREFFGLRYANDALSDTTFRVDGRQEAEYPLKFAGFNIVPFGTVRGTFWDGQPRDEGGLWRGLGIIGARGAMTLSRVYDDVQNELWDINRIRHIIKPQFVVWGAGSNTRSTLITPYDFGIETIDDFYGARLAINQVWQTKRGPAERQRSVDLVTLNLEAGFFGDAQANEISNGYVNTFRPEDSRTRNYIGGDLTYRLSDSTAVLYDFNFDLNDNSYDRHNIAVAVERNPRLAYIFGVRYAGDIDLALVGGGFNYKLNEKHITAVRFWHDVNRGDLGEIAVAYIRKMPRWYAGLNFEYDAIDDDFRVSLSLWPEGVPEWTLGSRRFSGLSTSTGIRP